MSAEKAPEDAAELAVRLANALDEVGCEYAIGGAIALGFWSTPRGTLDVDVTLFLAPGEPDACLDVLTSIGCDLDAAASRASLVEHGLCRAKYQGWRVDVFVPLVAFYTIAQQRRRTMPLLGSLVKIWDAETLCVFKMMFFRRKDLADVEQLLRSQGDALDAAWVDRHVEAMYGKRDPRVSTWREIVAEVRGENNPRSSP